MSRRIHQTVSSATFQKSIQYHLCVGCHPGWQSGHLSLKQILLENKGQKERDGGVGWGGERRKDSDCYSVHRRHGLSRPHLQMGKYRVGGRGTRAIVLLLREIYSF